MKKLFLLFFAAIAFAACSDDNYYYELTPGSYTVDFEGALLGADGYIWGKPQSKVLTDEDPEANYFGADSKYFFGAIYAQGDASFYTFFTDYLGLYGSVLDTWNGFVISNHTDMETSGFVNDKSVYATAGADGSKQFAVAYYGAWTGAPYGIPTIHFTGAVKTESVAVANTTYLYLYCKNEAKSLADVKGVITGYNSGIKTGTVEVTLVDAASATVKTGWETVNLSSLGVVTKLTFTMATTDSMCPLYFAVDDLVYGK